MPCCGGSPTTRNYCRRSAGAGWAGLWSRDQTRRRRTLKELAYRLPFRPTLRFLYMYLLRGGFLDGRAGLTYCRLLAIYEYLIVLKTRELLSGQGPASPQHDPPCSLP